MKIKNVLDLNWVSTFLRDEILSHAAAGALLHSFPGSKLCVSRCRNAIVFQRAMCDLKYFAFSRHSNHWWMTCCNFPSQKCYIFWARHSMDWYIYIHKINPSLLHYCAPSILLRGVMMFLRLRFWFRLHFQTNPKVQGSPPMLHKIPSLKETQLHSSA